MKASELKEVLRLHKLWLEGNDVGVRANLGNVDLSYADLSNANLFSANLSYANLSDANLFSANLSYANLRNVDLSYANLSSANLRNVDLSYANLFSANLSYANLRNADLSYANLSNVDLCNASLHNASLLKVDLREADLRETLIVTFCAGRDFGFYQPDTGYCKIGCIGMQLKEWQKEYKTVGIRNSYSESEIDVYGLIINELLPKIIVVE
jgi:uncharacterized protein YjbI with pentapeptide repeats